MTIKKYRFEMIILCCGFVFFTLLLWNRHRFSIVSIPMLFYFTVLLLASIIDVKCKIIPNRIPLILFLCGFVLCFADRSLPWQSRFIGAAAGTVFIGVCALLSRGGIGGGDLKIIAASGLVLGWMNLFSSLFIALLMAGSFSFILLLISMIRRTTANVRKSELPFIPFLLAGILLQCYFI